MGAVAALEQLTVDIATRPGRNAEVVQPLRDVELTVAAGSVTALIGESVDELVELAPRLGEIDRRACRREAERRFSAKAMAIGYERVYKRVIEERQGEELLLPLRKRTKRVPVSA